MIASPRAIAEERDSCAGLPRRLPYEASILGAVIHDNRILERLDGLAVRDFWDPKHQVVFEAMRNLSHAGKPIALPTLEQQIARTGKLDAIGNVGFLGELALNYPTVENVDCYRDEVQACARIRDAAVFASEVQRTAFSDALEPAELLDEIHGSLARFLDEGRRNAREAPAFGRPFIEYIGREEPENNPSDIFDVHGLIVRGEPSLIIGDPKVGKTMLTTDLLLHAAAGRRHWLEVPIYRRLRILFAPREDSEQTTKRRIWQLARGAGIEMWELQDHLVIDGTSPLYFDDAKLTSKLERQLANFDVCAIDSLSTIHNADENSVERMAPIMNRWRDLSLGTRTAIPIVHHFRKRGPGAPSAATGGNVLQRARGSSIIGATTRHAVGVERGPDEHQIVISVESNHEVDTEPFVIRRRFGVDDQGRKYIRHERAGSLVDVRASKDSDRIDAATLAVIRRAGPDGIGIGRALRDAAIDELRDQPGGKGCRPVKVDHAADRLSKAGAIARIGDRWRVA